MSKAAPAAVALLVLACGGPSAGETGTDDPAGCTDGTAPTRSVAGAVKIGIGAQQTFAAYDEGSPAELVLGMQGGWMVTPTVRADGDLLGTDGACLYLDLDYGVVSDPPLKFHVRLPDAPSAERYWYFEGLPLFLSFDVASLEGRECRIAVTLIDDGHASTDEVRVTLVRSE
jgi:hypothetical protein